MNKPFITKNFLLIVMLLAVMFAFAMKATVFQRGTTLPATVTGPASGSTTVPVATSARSVTIATAKP